MILKSDHNIFCDVDETLIHHDVKNTVYLDEIIKIKNPYTGKVREYAIHQRHVELLKSSKSRGRGVIVWSQAGHKWASAVVKALELTKYVDLVMTKPIMHIDDLPCTDWMGNRVYLK